MVPVSSGPLYRYGHSLALHQVILLKFYISPVLKTRNRYYSILLHSSENVDYNQKVLAFILDS